jgi:hypothetical protein
MSTGQKYSVRVKLRIHNFFEGQKYSVRVKLRIHNFFEGTHFITYYKSIKDMVHSNALKTASSNQEIIFLRNNPRQLL